MGSCSGSRRVGRDDASSGSSPIIDAITNLGGAHPVDNTQTFLTRAARYEDRVENCGLCREQ